MPLCCFGGSHWRKKKGEMTTISNKEQIVTPTHPVHVISYDNSSASSPDDPCQQTTINSIIDEILVEFESSTKDSKPLAKVHEKNRAVDDLSFCYKHVTNTSSSLFVPFKRTANDMFLAQTREMYHTDVGEREGTRDKESQPKAQREARPTMIEAESHGAAATPDSRPCVIVFDDAGQHSVANEAPVAVSDIISSSTADDAIAFEAHVDELKAMDIHYAKWGGRDEDESQVNDEKISHVDEDKGGASTRIRDDDEPSFVKEGADDEEKVAYRVSEETVETITFGGTIIEVTGVTEMSHKTEHAVAVDNGEKGLSTAEDVAASNIDKEGEWQGVAERKSAVATLADIYQAVATNILFAEETNINLTGENNEEKNVPCTACLTNIDAELAAEGSIPEVEDALCLFEEDECEERHLHEVVSECVTAKEALNECAAEEVVVEAALVKADESTNVFVDFNSASPSQAVEDNENKHGGEKKKETILENENKSDENISDDDDIWAHGWPIFGVPRLHPIWLSLAHGPHLAPFESTSSTLDGIRKEHERSDRQVSDGQTHNLQEDEEVLSDRRPGWQKHVRASTIRGQALAYHVPTLASDTTLPLLQVPPLGLTPPAMDTSFMPFLHAAPPPNMSPSELSTKQSRSSPETASNPVVCLPSQLYPTSRTLQPPPRLVQLSIQNPQKVGFGAQPAPSFTPGALSTLTPRLPEQVAVLATSMNSAQASSFEANRRNVLESAGVPHFDERFIPVVTSRFSSSPMNSARFIPPAGFDIPRF